MKQLLQMLNWKLYDILLPHDVAGNNITAYQIDIQQTVTANTVERYADDLKRISDQIEKMERITKVTFFIRS